MLWQLLALLAATVVAKDDQDLTKPPASSPDGFELRNYGLTPPFIPNLHWVTSGLSMITPRRVVLTRDLPSVYGAIWNKNPVQFRDWQAVINFRIYSAANYHADGLAFWYTKEIGGSGKAYGAPHKFSGLGIALDTYSNRNRQGEMLSALFNEGDKDFDAAQDGESLPFENAGKTGQLVCNLPKGKMFATSNTPAGETARLLVRYFQETLSVYYAGYSEDSWTLCGKYDGLFLPLGYHFGVSAATGDLHSSHELASIRVFELKGHHEMGPFPVPMALGDMTATTADRLDAHRSGGPVAWWIAFKIAAYSAFVAVLALVCFLAWREFHGGPQKRNKFY